MIRLYRLWSAEGAIHAPGMVRNALTMWKTGDQVMAIRAMSAWETLPVAIALDVLDEKVPFTVDGDRVIIRVDDGGPDSEVDLLMEKDLWSEHEEYPRDDWEFEVSNGDTLRGYREWVRSKILEKHDEDNRAAGCPRPNSKISAEAGRCLSGLTVRFFRCSDCPERR